MLFSKKKKKLLRSCVFDFSALGVLPLRSCVLHHSPPPLPLFSYPPSKFILVHPSTICWAEHVKLVACSPSRANACHDIRSSRTNVGRFRVLVLDDLISWHEELPRLQENATNLTCFVENFFVILLTTSQPVKNKQTNNKQTKLPNWQSPEHT